MGAGHDQKIVVDRGSWLQKISNGRRADDLRRGIGARTRDMATGRSELIMNQQERFEAFYADQHGVEIESMTQYRLEDAYRLPGIAAHYRTFKAAEDLFELRINPSARDVIGERQRQVTAEGMTLEHDDRYKFGEMALAAACYAIAAPVLNFMDATNGVSPRVPACPGMWPWSPSWWKPRSSRENLVRSGALILAEIERIDRKEESDARNTEG